MTTPLARQFVWTVLPSGRVTTDAGEEPKAQCSLLVTPRLIGPVDRPLRLTDFGLQLWPQRLTAVTFTARRGTTPVPVGRTNHVGIDGATVSFSVDDQQSSWATLFPPDTAVRPYQPTTYADRATAVFPAGDAGEQIRTAYSDAGHALATVPRTDHTTLRMALRTAGDSWRTSLAAPGPGPVVSPLQQAYDFYRRPDAEPDAAGPVFRDVNCSGAAEEPDFHDIVARLVDHPLLLRALGLLIDLAVPAAALGGDAGPAVLTVIPTWPQPDTTAPPGWAGAEQQDLTPGTAYTLEGTRFVPATATGPAAAPFAAGMLAAGGAGPAGEGVNSRFEVMPFDVDGAALRMVSAAAAGPSHAAGSPDDTGLPALRSVGPALLDRNRAAEHDNRLSRAQERSTPSGLLATPLTAENLIAGYRVDILDTQTQQWRSLCRRHTQYRIGSTTLGPSPAHLDEGCVRIDAVSSGTGTDDTLYVHEIVARWDGWSLVAPRPDRIADTFPAALPGPVSADVGHDPGSLPRLRFGRDYRLRVRLADLAGGGVGLTEPGGDEQPSQTFTHRRFEPILPPEVLPTRPFTDGESHSTLVIRSDRGVSPADYAAAHGYRAHDLRYLFAPKASLELAIQHGTFDKAVGSTTAADVDHGFADALRADRDLLDIAGAERHRDAPDSAEYVVVPETVAAIPWLPDPAARLLAVLLRSRPIDPRTGTPGTAPGLDDDHNQHRWPGTWPDVVPVGLDLVAGDAGCAATFITTGDVRAWTIALGPAEQAVLDLVSCPGLDDIPAHGPAVWAGAATDATTGAPNEVAQQVHHGHVRTVSPPRTITLVHAVQRPLIDPTGTFVASRQVGDTDAVLRTTELFLDIPSTGRLDVHAAWSEFEDTVTQPPTTPASRSFSSQIGSYDVAYLPPDQALPPIKHIFGDTRRRQVSYTLTAVSRFHDYFAHLTAVDPDACTVRRELSVTDVPSSARAPAPQVRHVVPAFGWTRGSNEATHTSTRRGGQLRVFLERPWFASGDEERLAVIVSAGGTTPNVSVAGSDPVSTSGATQSPMTAAQVVAPQSATEPLAEAGASVTAMLFPVTFDPDLNCWRADIDLSPLATASYFPFVRLSLCRYQSHTVIDVPHLSPPVEVEPLQLFPTRELTVTSAQGGITATLGGIAPGGATPNVVHVEFQVADSATVADDAVIGPFGWITVGIVTGTLGQPLRLAAPTDPTASSRPQRVLVTETEAHPAPHPAPGTATDRVVYLETVRLQ